MIEQYKDYKVFDLPSASKAYESGAMSAEEFIHWLLNNGYSQDSDGNFSKDDRSAFVQWLHDKFGPKLAQVASTIVTLGATNELLNSSGKSNVTVDSATGNDIINQQGNSGLSQFFGNLWTGLKDFGASALSGLSQVGTGIIGQLASSALNYDNQVKLIDKQNEYNTPAAQMQRFAEAGLNPNLIYGLGSNGNQPASGSVAPVDFDTSQRENRLVKFQMQQEALLNQAEIQERQANVRKANAEADGQDIDNELRRQTFDNQVAMAEASLNDMINSVNLKAKEIKSFDDYREAQMDLWKTQMYANMLSGHSVFGKVTLEAVEYLKSIQDWLEKKYPQYSNRMEGVNSPQPLSTMPPELFGR